MPFTPLALSDEELLQPLHTEARETIAFAATLMPVVMLAVLSLCPFVARTARGVSAVTTVLTVGREEHVFAVTLLLKQRDVLGSQVFIVSLGSRRFGAFNRLWASIVAADERDELCAEFASTPATKAPRRPTVDIARPAEFLLAGSEEVLPTGTVIGATVTGPPPFCNLSTRSASCARDMSASSIGVYRCGVSAGAFAGVPSDIVVTGVTLSADADNGAAIRVAAVVSESVTAAAVVRENRIIVQTSRKASRSSRVRRAFLAFRCVHHYKNRASEH